MKLNELFEASKDVVAISFGRFNPPHKGHRAAWELMAKSGDWYVGTNSSTQGPKDPLPYDVKVEAMKAIYPSLEGHLISSTSWLTMASELYKKYKDAKLLVFTDEDWVTKTIQQYNGQENTHGFYNFSEIEQQPTPRLSSATALRDAVKAGDRKAFSNAAGIDADTKINGKAYFDLVAEYLMPYAEKEKAKAAKKKTKEDLEEAPIEMDPAEPMNPMIYSHDKANPAKLKYRMLRAAGQLKDLAARAENASPAEWQIMARQFEELKMNIEQIRHALEELGKKRKKGGIGSRGIDPMLDSQENVIEGPLGTVLSWPEVVNKINSVMKAMGWKGQRKDDNSYMFSTKGQLDDEFYMVIIENEGKNMFHYALGTVEEGDPHIGEEESLPTTEASVSELIDAVREGFGLGEQSVAEGYGRYYCSTDKKWKTRKGPKQSRKSS